MQAWEQEIRELHDVFEQYFLGVVPNDLGRVEAALAPEFSMSGPNGDESSRESVIASLQNGYAHTDSLTIAIEEPQLLLNEPAMVIASYIEVHQLPSATNRRRSTVVFRPDASCPNGLAWLRVHECWIPPHEDA